MTVAPDTAARLLSHLTPGSHMVPIDVVVALRTASGAENASRLLRMQREGIERPLVIHVGSAGAALYDPDDVAGTAWTLGYVELPVEIVPDDASKTAAVWQSEFDAHVIVEYDDERETEYEAQQRWLETVPGFYVRIDHGLVDEDGVKVAGYYSDSRYTDLVDVVAYQYLKYWASIRYQGNTPQPVREWATDQTCEYAAIDHGLAPARVDYNRLRATVEATVQRSIDFLDETELIDMYLSDETKSDLDRFGKLVDVTDPMDTHEPECPRPPAVRNDYEHLMHFEWARAASFSADDVADDEYPEGWDDLEECTHSGLIVKSRESNRVLLIQRTPDANDDEDTYGRWEFPGGSIDEGEDPLESAVREFEEETGLKLPDECKLVGLQHQGNYVAFQILVTHEAWVHEATFDPFETMGIGWFDTAELEGTEKLLRKVVYDHDWDEIREASKRTGGLLKPLADSLGMKWECPHCGSQALEIIDPGDDGIYCHDCEGWCMGQDGPDVVMSVQTYEELRGLPPVEAAVGDWTVTSRDYLDPMSWPEEYPEDLRYGDLSKVYEARNADGVLGSYARLRQWDKDGTWFVWRIETYDPYKRQGAATALIEQARRDLGVVGHSPERERTTDGLAWSQAVGKVATTEEEVIGQCSLCMEPIMDGQERWDITHGDNDYVSERMHADCGDTYTEEERENLGQTWQRVGSVESEHGPCITCGSVDLEVSPEWWSCKSCGDGGGPDDIGYLGAKAASTHESTPVPDGFLWT